jgi:uncharacterized LabA/DUF88 family protein
MRPKVAILIDGVFFLKRYNNLYPGAETHTAEIIDKNICKAAISSGDITADDIFYEMRQKGIDMKIGIDIASLSLKKQVNQIVLISGDEDFVPISQA